MGGEEEVEGGVGGLSFPNSLFPVSTVSSPQGAMLVPAVLMVMDEESRNRNVRVESWDCETTLRNHGGKERHN